MGLITKEIASGKESLDPNIGNYKVVVDRWSEGDCTSLSALTLYRREGNDWVACSREDPADDAIFNLAEKVDWLEVSAGEYALTGTRLDSQ